MLIRLAAIALPVAFAVTLVTVFVIPAFTAATDALNATVSGL